MVPPLPVIRFFDFPSSGDGCVLLFLPLLAPNVPGSKKSAGLRPGKKCIERLGLSQDDLIALRRGGVVHIRKVAVPERALLKPGPLDAHKRELMEAHTVIGARICAPLKSFRQVLSIIRWHHERQDGSGYADHLKGDQIPLTALVLQTVDIYDEKQKVRYGGSVLGPARRSQRALYSGMTLNSGGLSFLAFLRTNSRCAQFKLVSVALIISDPFSHSSQHFVHSTVSPSFFGSTTACAHWNPLAQVPPSG